MADDSDTQSSTSDDSGNSYFNASTHTHTHTNTYIRALKRIVVLCIKCWTCICALFVFYSTESGSSESENMDSNQRDGNRRVDKYYPHLSEKYVNDEQTANTTLFFVELLRSRQ